MKKSEIEVGGVYEARISGNVVRVRVDEIRQRMYGRFVRNVYKRYHDRTLFDVTNLKTGRKATFRSAAKFRSKIMLRSDLIGEGL